MVPPSDRDRRRDPVPFTRKDYESWAKKRGMGQGRFVRQAALSGGLIAPVTLGSFAGLLAICGKIEIGNVSPVLVAFCALLVLVFGAVLGGISGWGTFQEAERRFAATNQSDLDDQALLDEERTTRALMWSVAPGAALVFGSLFLPERFLPLFFVGFGMMGVAASWNEDFVPESRRGSRGVLLVCAIAIIVFGILGVIFYVPPGDK